MQTSDFRGDSMSALMTEVQRRSLMRYVIGALHFMFDKFFLLFFFTNRNISELNISFHLLLHIQTSATIQTWEAIAAHTVVSHLRRRP